jgi:acetyl-CoA acetyltransferase
MKKILKQILNEINNDENSFNLDNVDWDALKEAVKDEGVNKNSDYEDIKDVVLDLFESVGYEEFGIVDNN